MTTTVGVATAASSAARRFDAAARDVLAYLHDRFEFRVWILSRVDGDHYVILDAIDSEHGISAGDVYRWTDTLCARMVAGEGPHIAPSARDVPAYAAAPGNSDGMVGAYIGLPIESPAGELFGTLCAADPDVQPPSLVDELPLLQLIVRLLRDILAAELEAQRGERDAEHADLVDWEEFLRREEQRCRRLGHPATVAVVEVDPEDVEMAEHALRTAVRRQDFVAHLGGGRFGVAAVEAGADISGGLVERLASALRIAGVPAAIGSATRHPAEGLEHAWHLAAAAV